MLGKFLKTGHERSIKAKKNILASLIFKGLSIITNLAIVPLTYHYLESTKYGIWFTLSSVIAWFSFFDIGLGNGLRNKFAESLAAGNRESARIYVSTTYFILTLIIIFLLLLFFGINPFLNWVKILNAPERLSGELNLLVVYVFFFFCLRFVLKLITTILIADQRPAFSSLILLAGNILSLVIIYILTQRTDSSLLYLGLAVSVSPVIILFIASFFMFTGQYREYRPSFRFIRLAHVKELTNLGIQFFVIQIAAIILFSTDNMIITQLYSPAEVTPYNIAHKYLGIVTMVFGIIITPLWSAFTEAYVKGEFSWIKNSVTKMMKLWVLILFVVIFMVIISNPVYKIWIGSDLKISFLLTSLMGLFAVITCWNYIFTYFINGVGKIRLQLYSSVLVSIINIPLSIYFAKNLNLNISGVILATCVCQFIGAIWAPRQYYLIINEKATGIWFK